MKRHLISAPRRGKPIGDNPLWYKDAIIYEVRVRSFFDSNNDGVGDFRGLTDKLDYLQDLGVTAIWLLPFYPSPLRDDGYDIADYTDVNPDCGTLADFDQLLEEAHRRGLRIITELVLNHTSDQHPWFRRAPGGRPRDRPSATSTSGTTRPSATPKRASSSRTSRPRTGPGIRWRAPTTGTAFIRTNRISTSRTRRCMRRS